MPEQIIKLSMTPGEKLLHKTYSSVLSGDALFKKVFKNRFAASTPHAESPANRPPRLTTDEDAILLRYCGGDAALVAKARETFTPEQISAWLALMKEEPSFAQYCQGQVEFSQCERDREDAALLRYCGGDAALVAEVRRTQPAEEITRWVNR